MNQHEILKAFEALTAEYLNNVEGLLRQAFTERTTFMLLYNDCLVDNVIYDKIKAKIKMEVL